jgi:hypothetical protein
MNLHDFRISWFRTFVNGANEIFLNHMKLREANAELAEFRFRKEYPHVTDYELVELTEG